MKNGGVIGYYRGEAGSDPICSDCADDWRTVEREHPEWDAILSGSETDSWSHCDECGDVIDESLTSDGIEYHLDALDEWRNEAARGNWRPSDVLELWAEKLHWYGLERRDELRLKRFRRAAKRGAA